MSIGTQLMKAENLLKDVESYVEAAVWHSGKHFQATSHLAEIHHILKTFEKDPPFVFAELYLQQVEKARHLRERWLKATGQLPKNPWVILKTDRLPDWRSES
jgi:hypothetical protein